MKQFLTVYSLLIIFSSCNKTTFYIVRHAEKATAGTSMSSDVPLTVAGNNRANKLSDLLKNKNIGYIFSTQTIRTTSTAKPLSQAINVPVSIYDPRDTSKNFINQLKAIRNKNVLIIGHSNTVDDIVNGLTCKQLLADLPDSVYNNLFIVKRAGKKYSFRRKTFEP